jgi:hypothetical protein
MVYDTRNCWDFGLCKPSDILNKVIDHTFIVFFATYHLKSLVSHIGFPFYGTEQTKCIPSPEEGNRSSL